MENLKRVETKSAAIISKLYEEGNLYYKSKDKGYALVDGSVPLLTLYRCGAMFYTK